MIPAANLASHITWTVARLSAVLYIMKALKAKGAPSETLDQLYHEVLRILQIASCSSSNSVQASARMAVFWELPNGMLEDAKKRLHQAVGKVEAEKHKSVFALDESSISIHASFELAAALSLLQDHESKMFLKILNSETDSILRQLNAWGFHQEAIQYYQRQVRQTNGLIEREILRSVKCLLETRQNHDLIWEVLLALPDAHKHQQYQLLEHMVYPVNEVVLKQYLIQFPLDFSVLQSLLISLSKHYPQIAYPVAELIKMTPAQEGLC
ncbi:MAG: hypothetical protein HQM12_18075 [SAR324 cluster bacterium]|nr:hypothetical protein [SAR324 cluster bacterium]